MLSEFTKLADGVDYNHLPNRVNATLLSSVAASRLFSMPCNYLENRGIIV